MHPYSISSHVAHTTPAPAFPTRTSNPGWWNQYYYDHPGRQARDQAARSTDKWKVYCKRCFDSHIQEIQDEHTAASQAGITLNLPQSREHIESYLWSLKAEDLAGNIGRGWRRSATSTLLNHIANCTLQETDVRWAAFYSPSASKTTGTSPSRTRRVGRSLQMSLAQSAFQMQSPIVGAIGPPGPMATPLPIYESPSHPLVPSVPSLIATPTVSIPPPTPMAGPSRLGHLSRNSSPLTPSDALPSPLLFSNTPQSSPLVPSSSTLVNLPGSRVLSRSNSNSILHLRTGSPGSPYQYMNWTPERQQMFEYRLARITASAGLSLSWIENIEFITLIEELAPAAQIPSRKVLTNRIIPNLVKHIRATNKKNTEGGFSTLQADGWTAKNNHHFIAFMITLITKLYTVKVIDVTTQRKTAKIFLDTLIDVYHEVEKEWNVTIVAITTDASGETRKARREFVKKFPSVVVLDCYAHQINLIVGDYFKRGCTHLKYTKNAEELITWLRSKTLLLGLIQEEQIRQNKTPTTIIRPVLTRWTAHLRAYQRLASVENVLSAIVATELGRAEKDRLFITGDAASKARAQKMIAIIKDPTFWTSLQQVIRHLSPLGAAANAIQAAFCRLDTVLITFGYLQHIYSEMRDRSFEDEYACEKILDSLESRWSKADQEPFIASIIVNPLYQLTPFSKNSGLHLASALGLLKQLYRRFFSAEPSIEFAMDAVNCIRRTNNFANLQDMIDLELTFASHENRTLNPNAILQHFHVHGTPEPSFLIFARRLFSINANSASCERLFSAFGNILTKLRNRMGNNTLSNLSELALQVRDEHLRAKNRKEWLTKRFKDQSPAETEASRPLAPVGSAAALSSSFSTPMTLPSAFTDTLLENSSSAVPERTNEESPGSTFSNVINSYQSQLADDELDNDPVFPIHGAPSSDLPTSAGSRPSSSTVPEPAPDSMNMLPLIPISDLFNYDNPIWVKLVSEGAEQSATAELALYDLLNGSWGSHDSDEALFEIDETTEQLLMS